MADTMYLGKEELIARAKSMPGWRACAACPASRR